MTDHLFDLIGTPLARRDLWDLYPDDAAAIVYEPDADHPYQHVDWPRRGVEIIFEEREAAWWVDAVFLHTMSGLWMSAYQGALPKGLDRSMTPEEVIARLGPPDRTGPRTAHPICGTCPSWLSYRVRENVELKVSFKGDPMDLIAIAMASRPDV